MEKNKVFLLISTFILIGIIGFGALFLKEKFSIPFGFSDKAIVYTISSSGEYPRFLKAVIDPEDVQPGDIQKMLIEAESPDGIKEIKAEIEHDKGIDELVLTLKDGDKEHGQWVGEWEVHSTHSETYRTTFIAEDNTGKTNKIVLAWTDACVIPNNGDWILDGNCTILAVSGVDNGNFTISGGYTLTINDGATFAWNSGKTITISNGSIAIANGGELKKTNLWMIDSDDDGYSTNVQYAQSESPTGGKRRYLVTETGTDCDDNSDSIYPGVVTGIKDCDVDNYYFTDGTASATGTNYCKFRDYSNENKVCQSDGIISDPVCDSYADSTIATCGTCEYATGACSSCTSYNTSTSCGTKDCDYLNYYYTDGIASATGTNYCKYRNYSDKTRYCDGSGTCGAGDACTSYSISTAATCGYCKYATGACSSCTNYALMTACGGDCNFCQSGNCNSFEITCYPDDDSDGYYAKTGGLYCAMCPPGSASSPGNDCCDSDNQAKPGQTAYFQSANACGSFDYNCSGSNEKDTSSTCCNSCTECSGYGSCTKCSGYTYSACTYNCTVVGNTNCGSYNADCKYTGPYELVEYPCVSFTHVNTSYQTWNGSAGTSAGRCSTSYGGVTCGLVASTAGCNDKCACH